MAFRDAKTSSSIDGEGRFRGTCCFHPCRVYSLLCGHCVLPYHNMQLTVGTTVENGHPERTRRPHGPDTHCQWLGYNFTFGRLCMISWDVRAFMYDILGRSCVYV